jgi:hypothetical protein
MLAYAFGEEEARGDHVHAQFGDPPGIAGCGGGIVRKGPAPR